MISPVIGSSRGRWVAAAAAAAVVHALVVAAVLIHSPSRTAVEPQAAIALDLTPVAVAPPLPRHDTPNPDQTEAPQSHPAPAPTPRPPPFETPPEQTAATADADVVVAKIHQSQPSTPADAPPAPATTRQASLDLQADRVVAAPTTGGFNSGDTKPDDLWKARVKARIEQMKRYPYTAAAFKPAGEVRILMIVDRSGRLTSATIDSANRLSSFALLDVAALDVVHRAAPFPKPPPEVDGELIHLDVVVQFDVPPRP